MITESEVWFPNRLPVAHVALVQEDTSITFVFARSNRMRNEAPTLQATFSGLSSPHPTLSFRSNNTPSYSKMKSAAVLVLAFVASASAYAPLMATRAVGKAKAPAAVSYFWTDRSMGRRSRSVLVIRNRVTRVDMRRRCIHW